MSFKRSVVALAQAQTAPVLTLHRAYSAVRPVSACWVAARAPKTSVLKAPVRGSAKGEDKKPPPFSYLTSQDYPSRHSPEVRGLPLSRRGELTHGVCGVHFPFGRALQLAVDALRVLP